MDTFEGDYQFSNRFAIHLGYRFTHRTTANLGFDRSCTFTTGTCNSTTTLINEGETNSTHAFIAGGKVRPIRNWVAFWDIERGQADNVFTRLENYHYTNFRIPTNSHSTSFR